MAFRCLLQSSGGGLTPGPRCSPHACLRLAWSKTRAQTRRACTLFSKDVLSNTEAAPQERRAYPRSQGKGVEPAHPDKEQLVDISPYGASLLVADNHPATTAPVIRLEISFARDLPNEVLDCQVVNVSKEDHASRIRVRFVDIGAKAQRELFQIAKADMVSRSIEMTLTQCERGVAKGYRVPNHESETQKFLDTLVRSGAELTFAWMVRGRCVRGRLVALDSNERLLEVQLSDDAAPPSSPRFVTFSTAAEHEILVADSYLFTGHDGNPRMTFPRRCFLTDNRVESRIDLGLESPLRVRLLGKYFR